jgi:hypothetical protein
MSTSTLASSRELDSAQDKLGSLGFLSFLDCIKSYRVRRWLKFVFLGDVLTLVFHFLFTVTIFFTTTMFAVLAAATVEIFILVFLLGISFFRVLRRGKIRDFGFLFTVRSIVSIMLLGSTMGYLISLRDLKQRHKIDKVHLLGVLFSGISVLISIWSWFYSLWSWHLARQHFDGWIFLTPTIKHQRTSSLNSSITIV